MTKDDKRVGIVHPKYRGEPDPSKLRPKPKVKRKRTHRYAVQRYYPGWRMGRCEVRPHWGHCGYAETMSEAKRLVEKERRYCERLYPNPQIRIYDQHKGEIIKAGAQPNAS